MTNDRWGFGVAVGDYDNDGWPDLFVANFGKNRLYHNNHDGTFTDMAEKAGVQLGNWSSGPTFGDYDGDGRLDLFVSGYVHYDQDQPPGLDGKQGGLELLPVPRGQRDVRSARTERRARPSLPQQRRRHLHRCQPESWGSSDPNGYYGFTSIFVDLNNDGKVDLLVADDSTPNYLYINKGNGTFEDDSYASGYALNENGRETASMGVAVGDYQNNGRLGLFNTTFSDDYDVLYRNDGDANYTDDSYAAGVAEPTVPFLGWATEFIDYDNDGWKDLFIANGHVYPMVDQNNWGTTYAERPLLFHNQQGKKFDLVPAVEGTGLALVIPARGAAFGDLFNDGRIDVVINNIDTVPALLRNVNPDHHHWVELSLIGGAEEPKGCGGCHGVSDRRRACGSVATCSAAAALSPPTTPGYTSVWATRIKSMQWRFTGPAA